MSIRASTGFRSKALLWFLTAWLAVSCSDAVVARRTLPSALEHHVSGLSTFDRAAHVIIPESNAWNVALATIRSHVPVSRVDPAYPYVETHARYWTAPSSSERRQTRTRYGITFVRDPRVGLRPQVQGVEELRRRGLCDAVPTPWTVTEGQPGGDLAQAIGAALASLADVPLESFVFEGSPGELASRFAESDSDYLLTLGYGPDGGPVVEAMGRDSLAERRDVRIEVRSSYRATFVAWEGGTRVLVEAVLEHRSLDEDRLATDWTQVDPSRVVEGVYGDLARIARVRDLVLASAPADLSVDPVPAEPDLPPAVEDYRGAFTLYAAFTADPSRRGDPYFWQAANAVQVVVEAAGQRAVSDPVSPYAASGFIARPMSLELAGDTALVVSLSNGDPALGGRSVPYATVSAAAVASACRPVCFDSDGGNICITLARP